MIQGSKGLFILPLIEACVTLPVGSVSGAFTTCLSSSGLANNSRRYDASLLRKAQYAGSQLCPRLENAVRTGPRLLLVLIRCFRNIQIPSDHRNLIARLNALLDKVLVPLWRPFEPNIAQEPQTKTFDGDFKIPCRIIDICDLRGGLLAIDGTLVELVE